VITVTITMNRPIHFDSEFTDLDISQLMIYLDVSQVMNRVGQSDQPIVVQD
jgi:hypothetical protein